MNNEVSKKSEFLFPVKLNPPLLRLQPLIDTRKMFIQLDFGHLCQILLYNKRIFQTKIKGNSFFIIVYGSCGKTHSMIYFHFLEISISYISEKRIFFFIMPPFYKIFKGIFIFFKSLIFRALKFYGDARGNPT